MRIVLQRVKNATVIVDGATVGAIDTGLLVLLGFSSFDTPQSFPADIEYLSRKVLSARVFPSAEGKQWAGSASSERLPVLLVSQFTLHGNLRKNKPDFHNSAKTEAALALWDRAVAHFRQQHGADRVQTGVFGADMEVRMAGWGPVTLALDSANKKEVLWEEAGEGVGGARGEAGEGVGEARGEAGEAEEAQAQGSGLAGGGAAASGK